VLARYSGWGALSNVFHPYPRSDWQEIAGEVRDLLTPEEYNSARASTPNAHFTSPMVIQAMWAAMQHLGLGANAQILEPAMGVGHFFGLMPEALLPGCRRTGVELDAITARIAKQLYPDATVFAKGFEETTLPDNFFDAVIGNIPFGNYGVHDPAYGKSPVTRAIHDYFLAKGLDKLRPGGVMALVTSRYTMDKQDSTIRRYLAERSDLVAAIRLPNTAFKANAGTDVTTDILFLQKRTPGMAPSGGAPSRGGGETWRDLTTIDTPEGPVAVNEYFGRHPEMMLGEMRLEGSLYREKEPTLTGELSPERLLQAVAALPQGICANRGAGPAILARPPPDSILTDADAGDVKDGAYAIRDGLLKIRRGAVFEKAQVPASTAWHIRGLLAVRDAVRMVFRTQLDDAPDDRIAEARKLLNELYDSFVSRYGPLSSRDNVKAFAGDPDQPLLLSLETYDPQAKRAAKTAIFERRTLERYRPVEHVETAAEALAVSLNETGALDWPRMEQVTGRSARQLRKELGGLVYQNPEGGLWETADRYLSGDVRRKLSIAAAGAALDPSYERNIDALKAVQPADLEPGDIEARLGSSWIPASDVRDFIAELLDTAPRHVQVGHAPSIATWTVGIDAAEKWNVGNTTTHGTARFRAADLIEQALNGRVPTAYDEQPDGSRIINQQETIAAREKQQQLKDKFREWVWQDSARAARLARDYNDLFNNLRLRTFDGSHLTLPGMNRTHLRGGDLAPHQKNAVWRCLQSGSTLLGHVVGAGKTWSIAATAMEMRRLGLSKKPMIVVPNHLVEQWGAEFLKLYPQAKLFIAGKEHFCRKPPAGHGADRGRNIRRRHRLAPVVRVPARLRRSVQQIHGRAGGGAGVGDPRSEGGAGRQPPAGQGTGEGQEAVCDEAQTARGPRAQGRYDHLRGAGRRPDLRGRGRSLQEPVLHHENEPHSRPAELREQPRLRHVHEDPLSARDHRRARGGVRHRHADLEHHGRDVHHAALPGARSPQRARRGAFRRLGREFRGSGDGARTGSGRLRLPDAHALRQIHQSP
jgi:hypothetical protein